MNIRYIGCARRGELNIRVDHKDGNVTFVDDLYVLTDEPSINQEAKTRASCEGFVQPSMAEFVRTRLRLDRDDSSQITGDIEPNYHLKSRLKGSSLW